MATIHVGSRGSRLAGQWPVAMKRALNEADAVRTVGRRGTWTQIKMQGDMQMGGGVRTGPRAGGGPGPVQHMHAQRQLHRQRGQQEA